MKEDILKILSERLDSETSRLEYAIAMFGEKAETTKRLQSIVDRLNEMIDYVEEVL